VSLRKLYGASAAMLFVLFFGVWWLLDGLLGSSMVETFIVQAVAVLTTALQLAWLYQLNVDLGRRCGFRSAQRESAFSAILVAFLLSQLVMMGASSADNVQLAWVLLLLTFALLYAVSEHVAQKLVACEAAAFEAQRSRGWATLAFIFIPIGIWFLQPRIRRLLAEPAVD